MWKLEIQQRILQWPHPEWESQGEDSCNQHGEGAGKEAEKQEFPLLGVLSTCLSAQAHQNRTTMSPPRRRTLRPTSISMESNAGDRPANAFRK